MCSALTSRLNIANSARSWSRLANSEGVSSAPPHSGLGAMPPKATLSYTVLTTDEEWTAALKPDAEKGCLAVVECYAAWCGPSEAVTNTLTRMSVEMVGRRIKFFQANSSGISHLQKRRRS